MGLAVVGINSFGNRFGNRASQCTTAGSCPTEQSCFGELPLPSLVQECLCSFSASQSLVHTYTSKIADSHTDGPQKLHKVSRFCSARKFHCRCSLLLARQGRSRRLEKAHAQVQKKSLEQKHLFIYSSFSLPPQCPGS